MATAKAEVLVVEHPKGFEQGCGRCQTILAKGQYAIALKVEEEGKTFKYFVGINPPIQHCGEQKKIFECFDSEESAETKAREIREKIDLAGTTAGLTLYKFTLPGLN